MFDQFVGLLLLGLGLKMPGPNVKGESTESAAVTQTRKADQDEFKNRLEDIRKDAVKKRAELKTARQAIKTDAKTLRVDLQNTRRASEPGEKDDARELFEADIKEWKLDLQELKDKRKVLEEEFVAHRKEAVEEFKKKEAEFANRLKTIKDEKKRETASSINTKLGEQHERGTAELKKRIENLTTMLEKLITVAQQQGVSGDALTTAISEAKTAITDAQSALNEEAGKPYVASVSSETTLRTDMKTVISSMRSGLEAVQKKITTAKQELIDIVQLVRSAKAPVTPTPESSTTSAGL